MALAGFVAISALPLGFVPSLLCGLLAGLVVGAINGYMIGYWRVNPIIWTLAMVFMLDGILRWAYGGNQIYPDNGTPAGSAFLQLSQIVVFKFLPLPTLLLLVLVVVMHWLMKHTRFGAQVQLTGSANEVARLSGVPVARVVWLTFILSAFTTALAGVLLTSMNKQGTFETGQGYDFNSVTAVVLGGISLAGGRGKLLGVLGGVLVIGVLLNLMTLLGLGSFLQLVVKGLVFIAVVGLTSWFGRRSGRSNV
jgi:ribose/xylose/arabinose/galactoside ABC-type transport system permease subunit